MYYNYKRSNDFSSTLLQNSKTDFNDYATKMATSGHARNDNAYVGQNNLLWDLGVPGAHLAKEDVIDKKIAEVEKTFDLVMIMEHFDESLVLLADALCWPLEEVMYLKQNARLSELKSVPTDETKDIVRSWLHGDYKVSKVTTINLALFKCLSWGQIYNHFLAAFNRRIDAYGRDRMAEDVARLKRMNSELAEQCVLKTVGATEEKQKKPGK